MGFNTFILISLIYAVIGVRVIRQLIANRREAFDRNFTQADRTLVDQAAFFVLVPISVALHELGHAVAIWGFGGRVTDFGFYVFAGFVEYREPFSDTQRILVALAGPLVNVILSALAVAFVFLRRPPMRAAFNELLLQFAILSAINALVFYPLLDLASGLNGDWSQIYRGGVPALSGVIIAAHAGILALGYWAWRDKGMRARVATLTGVPRGAQRRPLGGLRPGQGQTVLPGQRLMEEATRRVASGWIRPLQGILEQRNGATELTLSWPTDTDHRAVVMTVSPDGSLDLWAGFHPSTAANGADGPRPTPLAPSDLRIPESARRHLKHLPTMPDVDTLTLTLRIAMESVDDWRPTTPPTTRP